MDVSKDTFLSFDHISLFPLASRVHSIILVVIEPRCNSQLLCKALSLQFVVSLTLCTWIGGAHDLIFHGEHCFDVWYPLLWVLVPKLMTQLRNIRACVKWGFFTPKPYTFAGHACLSSHVSCCINCTCSFHYAIQNPMSGSEYGLLLFWLPFTNPIDTILYMRASYTFLGRMVKLPHKKWSLDTYTYNTWLCHKEYFHIVDFINLFPTLMEVLWSTFASIESFNTFNQLKDRQILWLDPCQSSFKHFLLWIHVQVVISLVMARALSPLR